jgi:hypothetical protein
MKKVFAYTKKIEDMVKILLTISLFGWNLVEGAVYEHQYPLAMIHIYPVAIWRIMLMFLIILASDWCPSLTLMLGYFIFFYIMDLEVTIEKWSLTDLKKNSPDDK